MRCVPFVKSLTLILIFAPQMKLWVLFLSLKNLSVCVVLQRCLSWLMIAYVKLGWYVIVYSQLWSFFSWNNSLSFNVIPFAWVSSVCVHVLVNLEKYRNFTMVIKKTKKHHNCNRQFSSEILSALCEKCSSSSYVCVRMVAPYVSSTILNEVPWYVISQSFQ